MGRMRLRLRGWKARGVRGWRVRVRGVRDVGMLMGEQSVRLRRRQRVAMGLVHVWDMHAG